MPLVLNEAGTVTAVPTVCATPLSVVLHAIVSGGGAPLLEDEFTYRASPPIAADSVRDVRLPSTDPRKWNSPELAKQAELSLALTAENATTPAGTRLAANFGRKDAARLASLEALRPRLASLAAER